jgi:hypothetical protein
MKKTIPTIRARRLLWLGLALSLPLPVWAQQVGFMPIPRMFFVGALVTGFYVSSPNTLTTLYLTLYLGQGLLWLGATYLLARLFARLVGRDDGEDVDVRRVYVILGGLVFLALLPIYYMPMSSGASPANWLGIFR